MKIAFGSDLHLEFDENSDAAGRQALALDALEGADLVVLAGDIWAGRQADGTPSAVTFAGRVARETQAHVILVPGNHEFYGEEMHSWLKDARAAAAAAAGVDLLDNNSIEISEGHDSLRVIGSTLWTDFNLLGTRYLSAMDAERSMADYAAIRIRKGRNECTLRAADTIKLHQRSVNWLRRELSKPFLGLSLVVTHHLPVELGNPAHRGDQLAPAFASYLPDLLEEPLAPDIWIVGHVHWNIDESIGDLRILSNQRGYPGEIGEFAWRTIEVKSGKFGIGTGISA